MATTATSYNRLPISWKDQTKMFIETVKNDKTLKKWVFLIPTITTIACGILFLPNFGTGAALGFGMLGIAAITSGVAFVFKLFKIDENNKYNEWISNHLFFGAVGAPILEEILFRGCLQPLTTKAILWLVPAASATIMSLNLSVAVVVSVVAIGAIFGFVHYFNDHKNSHIQAVVTGIAGIALGLTAAYLGLPAAIGAHMLNNTIAMIGINASKKEAQTIKIARKAH
jgi:membrane protease YdiL (CAAX protease family)